MPTEYAIEMKGITKTFGSVVANRDVELNVRQGEILALLGENGSGKTTLMNMLSGIYKPDSGAILVNGRQAVINSPEDAKRLGIGMVHQHFKPAMTGFTPLSAFSMLVFILLYVPCVAAVSTLAKEMNSTKWTLFSIGWQLGVAYVASLLVYQVGSLFL